MPLQKIQMLGKEQAWGLWHVQETEEELSFLVEEKCPADIVNQQKRREWICGRLLIRSLVENLGLTYYGINKNEFGKPFLNKHIHHISLSHSFPYVAAQIDRFNSIGIDLEQPKDKLKKIAHRVFSRDEVANAGEDVVKLCIYWCAKEALYKLYGEKNLHFIENLQVNAFSLSDRGLLTTKINVPGKESLVRLQYLVTPEFVVVYTDVI